MVPTREPSRTQVVTAEVAELAAARPSGVQPRSAHRSPLQASAPSVASGAGEQSRVFSGFLRALVALVHMSRALGLEQAGSASCHGHDQVTHLRVLRLNIDG